MSERLNRYAILFYFAFAAWCLYDKNITGAENSLHMGMFMWIIYEVRKNR